MIADFFDIYYDAHLGSFLSPAITKNHMKNAISFAEYQARIKNIRTPEEAAAFAKELIVQADDNTEEATVGIEVQEPKPLVHQPLVPSKSKKGDMGITPWYDIAGNENDAMVITLYAKGMTTRDIVSYMKIHHNIELTQPGISAITDKK